MKKLIVVITVFIGSFVNGQHVDTITKQQHLDAIKYSTSDLDIKKIEIELLNLINSYRKSKGLNVLVSDSNLYKASLMQSDYMASINKVTHKNIKPGFETFTQRIQYFYPNSYGISAENACTGWLYECFLDNISPAQQIFNIWKSSTSHNQNMLNPNVDKIGLAISRQTKFEYFYANFDVIDSSVNSVISK